MFLEAVVLARDGLEGVVEALARWVWWGVGGLVGVQVWWRGVVGAAGGGGGTRMMTSGPQVQIDLVTEMGELGLLGAGGL